jgi:hypothetical protein
MKYNTVFSIRLKPHGSPAIRYGIDETQSVVFLTEETVLDFDIDLDSGPHKFIIDFQNKTNATPEMAVEIVSVTFEGMTFDRFKWAGKYYPNYPEPWASEQTEPLPEMHNSTTFLGWNGRWELEFTAPIFNWIHQTEHLGWIYD